MDRIGVLCSGGDAPGMNAAVRAVVRRSVGLGREVIGIRNGYLGLITDDLSPLGASDVGNIIQRGGTVLGSARCQEFHTVEGRKRAAELLRQRGIGGVVVIGGDGSYRGAEALANEHGVKVVGIPGTIDNDIAGTDYTIGFDTAVNTAVEAIDRLRDTAESHHRLFFVEVMGRTAGHIAVMVAIAGGAEEALVPETPTDLVGLCRTLQGHLESGKRSAIVIVAEGDEAGGAFKIAEMMRGRTGYDSRVCVLGHVQRGGSPTARDRVLAARLGAAAVDTLVKNEGGVALGTQCGRVVASRFPESYEQRKGLDQDLIALSRALAG